MASKLAHPAEGGLECLNCRKNLTDPLMLPCLHTLCRHCIEGLVTGRGQKVRCPTCHHECKVPTKDVSGFPKTFFLSNLREVFQELKEGKMNEARRSGQRECDNAKHDNKEHGKATAFRADCAEFCCETCVAFHKKFGATRGHQLKPAADVDRITALAVNAQKRT